MDSKKAFYKESINDMIENMSLTQLHFVSSLIKESKSYFLSEALLKDDGSNTTDRGGNILKAEVEIKCNYVDCAAGYGTAGHLQCFLGGNYSDENCLCFQPEPTDEEIEEYIKRERGKI